MSDAITEPEVRATCNVAQRMRDTNTERGTEYRMDPGLAAALDAERAAHEETRRALAVCRETSEWADTQRAKACEERERAEAALADVSRRCGGYPDSRADGDGGIVAVVVRERDEALEDARLWREQQAEIEADLDHADGTLAANDAVRALPEAERRAAIVSGAGEIWTDEEHARMRDVAATMPVFVRVCQEKAEAIRRRDEAQAALADVSRRCGGYTDSRVDGDGGIVAVIVRERDEAQTALVALHEAAEYVCDALMSGDTGCIEEAIRGTDAVRDALSATPAALAGQMRARVLREAAKSYDAAALNAGRTTVPGDWLRALADEEEKTT